MNAIEHILEFDKVKEKWMEFAYTEWAKEKIKNTIPIMEESRLLTRQRETTEARILLEKGGTPPLVSLEGIGELLEIAEKGGCLTGQQLEQIETTLVAVKRLKDYLSRCKQFEISLAYYEENFNELSDVKEMIHLQIRNGMVDDNASKLLKSLRSDIERAERKMREKADLVMKSHKECMSDNFSTSRNGHICIPVKKEYKFKISGSVIDKSATGNTLFMEPSSVAKYYEELQLLKIDAENEERRILYALTDMVAEAAEEMQANAKMLQKLDFIFSKGKLSMEFEGVEPKINVERRIVLKDGRHPLMDKSVCVPLQFEIGNGIQGIVITGPNTGGKTVAIKTVALNCMMAQCGLHVACTEAEICMNSNFLCDIGDGQNISENLSTFSAHITNVLDILKKVNKDSLVIMDELGSGTDPTEGMGIAIAILQELKKSGALFLVTTHYPEVKHYAEQEKRILNATMTFDKESLRPLYQLVLGEAGESCAFYIAQKLGMPSSMLQCAINAAYGQEQAKDYNFQNIPSEIKRESTATVKKKKVPKKSLEQARKYQLGDSVTVYPDKKIGIVCETVNEKGVLRVQLQGKKIWINHKRVKLLVAAEELYPEDYDFSIIFDTVENRKLRHKMERKYVEGEEIVE
ncbi:MAG: DNA mismatch repair protein MutS [Lachnospiraceae bacterium]|nr:DNA mismatch repair protein MutS [Lachnospiraceae bacterium]